MSVSVTPVKVVKRQKQQPNQVVQQPAQQPQQQTVQNPQQQLVQHPVQQVSHSPPVVMSHPSQISTALAGYQQPQIPSQVVYYQPQPGVLQMTPQDLAVIIYAAQGKDIRGMLNIPQEKQGFIASTLGATADGMHRIADGARDILGGFIDIVTLGKGRR